MQRGQERILILAVALLFLALGSTPGQAQQEPLHGLKPVEQLVADRGPLSTSLRWVQYGLREPYSFSELYQLPVGQNDFVRRNAGLWAVFPRSLYFSTNEGVYPSVPAGTVFYIGGPEDVIARIAEVQAPYVQVGSVPLDRVEESRLEAALLDRRVPASSIQPTMSTGRGPVDTGPSEKPTPAAANQPTVRSEWAASMPKLDFIHDEKYRRRCVLAAMATPSDIDTNVEMNQQEIHDAPIQAPVDLIQP